jgi:hypothetical protein
MDEGRYLFNRRRLYHVKAVGTKELPRHSAHGLPAAHIVAVQIFRALNPLCHASPFACIRFASIVDKKGDGP